MFADALCIAQHPHDYNTVSSAGVPLQFSDALLWSPYQNNPVFHPRKCDCVEGRFWTEVQSELRHLPATCLAFMLSMIIWCCSTQSNWQPQFLRVQISRREVPEPEQNRCLKGRNLDLIFFNRAAQFIKNYFNFKINESIDILQKTAETAASHGDASGWGEQLVAWQQREGFSELKYFHSKSTKAATFQTFIA